ncbi:tRNA (adenosine(37)-N6)-dimethylallyltransferase MiaA [Oceanithermus desulfurans]|uniref:tRNA dimethylallyltransferase n=2 Tax=Oceanithermus desulfurans TaxID=227924 RepID=A0A511RKQ8_9DEIN|nr:tRNA (adenosine(37)-N6)-dimethylallyltransferase MiaA [Oceanithermus desulfurans]MBB6029569.1 tRNA dimethylallyltransferase [Oceanithermus desulfurans]GEM90205.1 tRNA dimethylallyltransferase [Oceanithermus desulfurans NBRC 100063]
MNRAVPVLTGPSASGKSSLALWLADRWPLEIVSADATMVYRGLDVGTDKPSAAERARVPHHLVDVVEPDEAYDVVRWVEAAERAIAEVFARGRIPLVVGGTVYYLRGLCEGRPTTPPPDAEVQRAIRAELEGGGADALLAELAAASPADAARVAGNPRRLVRALEVLRRTGRPPADFPPRAPRLRCRKLVLWPERAALKGKVWARARWQFEHGLIDEVRALLARYPRMPTALQSIGYKEVVRYLQGEWSYEEALEADRRAVWRLIKRQYTWLRREPGDVAYLPRAGAAAREGAAFWFERRFGLP